MQKDLLTWFKVKPNPDKPQFYRVLIFASKEAMHRHDVKHGPGTSGRYNFEAQASHYDHYRLDNGHWKKMPCVGEIVFHKDYMGAGVVSHEMTHAGLYWLTTKQKTEKGYRLSRRDDEKLAGAVGEMSRQFWVKFFKKWPTGDIPEGG